MKNLVLRCVFGRKKAEALGHPQALRDLYRHNCAYVQEQTNKPECVTLFRLAQYEGEKLVLASNTIGEEPLKTEENTMALSDAVLLEQAYWLERDQNAIKKAQALAIYHSLAEKQHPVAYYRLAVAYDIGNGVKRDAARAFEWYAKAMQKRPNKAQMRAQDLSDCLRYAKRFSGAEAENLLETVVWYVNVNTKQRRAVKGCYDEYAKRTERYLTANDLYAVDYSVEERMLALAVTLLFNGTYNQSVMDWVAQPKKSWLCNSDQWIFALHQIGVLYANGEGGFPKDREKALAWLAKVQDKFSYSKDLYIHLLR